MLKKAKVKVKRMGLKSYKALFSIRVLKITLPWDPSFVDDPNVSVSFERGGKMASTTEQELSRQVNQTAVSNYDEKLTLIATLFGNDAGDFQEKKGKIIVRQLQSKFFKRPTHRVIGTVTLDLRFVANKTESNVLILPLEDSAEGSSIEITISGEVLGENDESEETMSLNSDSSSGTLSSVLGLNTSNSFTKLSSAFGFSSPNTRGDVNRDEVAGSDTGSKCSSRHSTPGRDVLGDNEDLNESLDGSIRSKGSMISRSSVSDRVSEAYVGESKADDRDYISTLELKLFRQQRQHEEEVKRLKDQLESMKITSSKKIDTLNREVLKLKDKRSLGEKFRDSLTSSSTTRTAAANNDGDSAIEIVLRNTQEALAAAIASTEREAALRLQKEVELETTIDELVDTKVRYANVASELDVERVKVMRLRDRLEQYAETLTKMEVRLNNGYLFRNPANSKINGGDAGRNIGSTNTSHQNGTKFGSSKGSVRSDKYGDSISGVFRKGDKGRERGNREEFRIAEDNEYFRIS